MDPRQSPHVFKYFDPADRFVRIRVCDAAEAGIRMLPGLDRAAYRRAVVAACVEGFEDPDAALGETVAASEIEVELDDALTLLYQMVIAVNPSLEIRTVGLPAPSTTGSASAGTETSDQPALRLAPGVDSGDAARTLRRHARGLAGRLGARVFGQDEAVERVAAAVRHAASGLRPTRGPLASLLFVGPTGTGKTELARALADELAEGGVGFVRIDCGELAQGHETAKLLGAPPGYVGFEDGGMLSEAMKRTPRAVVLFDEIEKAHPRLHNTLLSLLEEGELTDGKGQRIRFSDAIVLFTSNAGAREASTAPGSFGFTPPGVRDGARREIAEGSLARTFTPEFLGRLDDVVHFRGLDARDARRIARAHLGALARRVRDAGLRMHWTDAVAAWAAREGFSDASGARGIGRLLRREVEGPLAEAILARDDRSPGSTDPGGSNWMRVTVRAGRPHVAPENAA